MLTIVFGAGMAFAVILLFFFNLVDDESHENQ